ncbi:phosphoenolpyruvate carboxykinase [Clostridium sp. SYSU_GA19001]|uniref:phosphoenolpyruvate carboxykinase n=1 Tax=Clostridium caldaquaticum TaxID=2940653 RepID=UPI002076E5BB|nr:phosphoenolpyruvate carboxykinase [Clostridium caldaquaticum]MCM8711122.1 phosphoenolpyruvate carboxykinase [Clostridium caldaquaticum]
MKKEFSLSNDKVMINFTVKYCETMEKLIDSNGFKRVVRAYLDRIKMRRTNRFRFIEESLGSKENELYSADIIRLLKLLTIERAEEVIEINSKYEKILKNREEFLDLIEDLYGFWRKLERYTVVHSNKVNDGEGYESVSFIDANANFSKLILNTYRRIAEHVIGYKPAVYRQLPAGGNAALIVNNNKWDLPEDYLILKNIPFITSILLNPPFISYPKKNTRSGFFKETFENPLKNCNINKDHFFCYPAKVGNFLAYIYFHRDFMSHGVTLCNLFEMAREEECEGVKPDIVYVFGARDGSEEVKTLFYDDDKNGIMLGYVNYGDAIDYFGYMKKMILTLHNLLMIKKGYLPIHGAMVNMVMKNGKSANVIIMGDSGAGKSESLEAFRGLSEDYISDMTIVFDDMGAIKLNENGKPLAYGTEIGAFVRLDDLDQGYAFKEIDRSIFMNPDKINARLVMPVATYKEIIKGYPVDLFLYANNYEDVKEGESEIEYFSSPEEAIKVFRAGARMAKGTTSEKGLVESYFANPFGSHQRQEQTDVLLTKYFNNMFNTGVKVGQIKTCLGIAGKEKEGPKNAAIRLFEIIKSL